MILDDVLDALVLAAACGVLGALIGFVFAAAGYYIPWIPFVGFIAALKLGGGIGVVIGLAIWFFMRVIGFY